MNEELISFSNENMRCQSQTLEGTIMDVSIIFLLEKFFSWQVLRSFRFQYNISLLRSSFQHSPLKILTLLAKVGTLWQMCAEHFSPKNKLATIKFDQLASFHQG